MPAPPIDDTAPVPVSVDVVGMLITLGAEELQVSGTPVMTVPEISVMVVVNCSEPVCEVAKVGVSEPFTASRMACTGHVMNVNGTPMVLLVLERIVVIPGVRAVTCTWPMFKPGMGASSVETLTEATLAFALCHKNPPTVDVISVRPDWLRLYAVACKLKVCPLEMQPND